MPRAELPNGLRNSVRHKERIRLPSLIQFSRPQSLVRCGRPATTNGWRYLRPFPEHREIAVPAPFGAPHRQHVLRRNRIKGRQGAQLRRACALARRRRNTLPAGSDSAGGPGRRVCCSDRACASGAAGSRRRRQRGSRGGFCWASPYRPAPYSPCGRTKPASGLGPSGLRSLTLAPSGRRGGYFPHL